MLELGLRQVRDAFALAKEKSPCIIFIDEIDAIGTKRFDSDANGDREVQRTMLELLNQLDGFGSDDNIKVCCTPTHKTVLRERVQVLNCLDSFRIDSETFKLTPFPHLLIGDPV